MAVISVLAATAWAAVAVRYWMVPDAGGGRFWTPLVRMVLIVTFGASVVRLAMVLSWWAVLVVPAAFAVGVVWGRRVAARRGVRAEAFGTGEPAPTTA